MATLSTDVRPANPTSTIHLPPPDRTIWDRSWRAYEAARAFDEQINARYTSSSPALQDELADEWDASGARLGDAEWAVFETPAYDLSGLEWKLKLLSERCLAFEDDIAAVLLANVRRLNRES